jgi:hypothetical protein
MHRMPDPAEHFETWLLHRVAQAVEAGEVSADFLTEVQAEVAEAHERPPDDGHAVAVQELAERCGLSVEQLTERLAALEAQPRVTRELFLRQVVEAWLNDQRDAYRAGEHGD